MNGQAQEADPSRDALSRFRREARLDLLVWICLLAIGGASFGVAFLPLGRFAFPINVLAAAAQIALLGLFFMQLRHARQLVLLTAISGFVFIIAMFGLTLNDLFTRG